MTIDLYNLLRIYPQGDLTTVDASLLVCSFLSRPVSHVLVLRRELSISSQYKALFDCHIRLYLIYHSLLRYSLFVYYIWPAGFSKVHINCTLPLSYIPVPSLIGYNNVFDYVCIVIQTWFIIFFHLFQFIKT